jgi:PD-(D/E)XK endonuclease
MLSTDQKGAIAEAEIAAAAIKLGVGVYRPLMEGGRYDLILEVGSLLLRVQCKWARRHYDIVLVRCYSCRRTREGMIKRCYAASEVDVIAAYCQDIDRCFLLPSDLFDGRSAIQLRLAPARNNQRVGVNWAADFDFDARLEALVGP